MCRSRRELSNEFLLAKFGFDTAENEPSKVYRSCSFSTRMPRSWSNRLRTAVASCAAKFGNCWQCWQMLANVGKCWQMLAICQNLATKKSTMLIAFPLRRGVADAYSQRRQMSDWRILLLLNYSPGDGARKKRWSAIAAASIANANIAGEIARAFGS